MAARVGTSLLFGPALPRRRFFVGTWVAYGVLSLVLLLLLLAGIGLLTGAYDPFEATVHQELIPADLRARAFAILLAAEMMVVPLSMLLYGFLLDAAGLHAGLALFAAGGVLLAAYAVANRPARWLEPAAAGA